MFTGIIEHRAALRRVERRPRGARLTVDLGPCAEGTRIGDSIALDGVCLTVAALAGGTAQFDVVAETLARSTLGERRAGERVNCERSLRVGQALGGHFVQGHVDGVGRIAGRRKIGDGALLVVECGRELAAGMVEKGSIAVDGVSLTLADAARERFSVALVPFTLAHTGLGAKPRGTAVNLETDVLGKYVRKLIEGMRARGAEGGGGSGDRAAGGSERLTRAYFEEHGFNRGGRR